MVRYSFVPSTASAGVDMTDTIGDTNVTSTTASTIARPRNKVTEFPTVWEAFFLSPPPIACAMMTVDPMASPTIMTVIICIT